MAPNEKLSKGFTINSTKGTKIEVVEWLGGGGQGDVYKVRYGSEMKALKWYKPEAIGNFSGFYNNIKQNVINGAPSSEFLWPIDITPRYQNTFGYIMDLRPAGYYELSDFLLSNVNFASFKVCCDAALHIISAFRILHNKGYAYQDLNDGNFFINPNNGQVLICDNDNVAPSGETTGIIGKPRYIAPEVVMGKTMPNNYSDRFSMALILFMLMCHVHPFEGKRSLGLATPEMQNMLYGKEALFIMDPSDKANAPDRKVHAAAILLWSYMPSYIKDLFNRAFLRTEGLHSPARRPSEADWLEGFARFRSDIIPCRCGNEVFTQDGQSCKCEKCGCKIIIPFSIHNNRYAIPGVPGARIYRCQFGRYNADEALNPVGMIISNPSNPKQFGLKNMAPTMWKATTPSGNIKNVQSKEVVPLIDGITIEYNNATVRIIKNQ